MQLLEISVEATGQGAELLEQWRSVTEEGWHEDRPHPRAQAVPPREPPAGAGEASPSVQANAVEPEPDARPGRGRRAAVGPASSTGSQPRRPQGRARPGRPLPAAAAGAAGEGAGAAAVAPERAARARERRWRSRARRTEPLTGVPRLDRPDGARYKPPTMSNEKASTPKARYRRILLKLSGEALMGDGKYGISPKTLMAIAQDVKDVVELDVEVAIVIGGGNIFRGVSGATEGMDRAIGRLHGDAGHGHQRHGPAGRAGEDRASRPACSPPSRCTRWPSPTSAAGPSATWRRAGWSSSPPAPATPTSPPTPPPRLRAMEIDADVMLKATKVDGVYTDDPKKNPAATKFNGAHLHRRAEAEPQGDGLDRHLAVHGQQAAHHRLRPHPAREHPAGGRWARRSAPRWERTCARSRDRRLGLSSDGSRRAEERP